VKKELATVLLNADGAADGLDNLVRALCSLLLTWFNEHIIQELCGDHFSTLLALVDLPGPQNVSSRPKSLNQFVVNLANERLRGFVRRQLFEAHVREYKAEGIAERVPSFNHTERLRLLTTMPAGLVHVMDDQARWQPKKMVHSMVDASAKRWGPPLVLQDRQAQPRRLPTFTVRHYHRPVTHSAEGFLDHRLASVSPDFASLRGVDLGGDNVGSSNPCVNGLFSNKEIAT
jgi:chitin synthase